MSESKAACVKGGRERGTALSLVVDEIAASSVADVIG